MSLDEDRPVDVGRRLFAGLIDLVLLGLAGSLCSLGPLAYGGAALPMIGSLVAITAYAILPAAAFGATPGMAIAGTRIVSVKGGVPDATEIAFRELVGRGLIGAAYFATAAIGLAGYLSGYLRFFVPRGLGLFLFAVSALLLAFSAASHLAIVLRRDGRALHDLWTRTRIVRRSEVRDREVVEDEVMATLESGRRRRRLRGFVVAELMLMVLTFGLPVLVSTTPDGPADLEDRVALKKAVKRFEQDKTDLDAAAELASLYQRSGRFELAATVESEHEAAMKAAGLEPSDLDYQVKKYRALLKGTPCALGSAVALGERLNQLGAHDSALETVSHFEGQCGVRPRLWWITLEAHRGKGELDAAVADSTRLIEDRPEDSDFWWWRGEDLDKKGDRVGAESDYRQSMAVYADRFAASRFADLMMQEGDRCEGVYALQHLLEENAEAAGSWAEAQLAELHAGVECPPEASRGSVSLNVASDGSVRTEAVVDKRKGRFLVHATGYVTVTRAFAEKAGLVASATSVGVRVADHVVPAQLAVAGEIAVGKSRASHVAVAIVDALPDGADGLLGLSYLWRFQIERTAHTLELRAR